MDSELTHAEVQARIRWTRMCMALLVLQDDLRIARDLAELQGRKSKRW
ncbi:hypothetical protein [Duganella callida]|nr:hypothetical protein [Duganella callida]